ncbi:NAD(P)/FAD-dependent oxidoreductase [Phycicoccus sp.]|uniref:NAD(P)/FAD-dependent oxidoreductase n=1 Tax=Phycicoccus sp. TaxID=1902410 RepID=UPI002B7AAC0F|nr:NAD(P)/FAD-dependent oxidoreductase [Phycicoccus sp.]HMM95894.1 NAD(P)/FAD-dependent oxidoreductase [Phycicoccus sp.]
MPRRPVRRVAVVGGGVAGLAVAGAASASGSPLEVVVHEAQPERAGYGTSLALWPSARRALAGLGALEAVTRAGLPVGPAALHTIDGRALTREHTADLLAVPRPALLSALSAALPASVRVVEDEVTDPADLDADLVIGADGVRSRVRALVAPRAGERLETPWVALRGHLDRPPSPGAAGEYWGPGLLFGLVPSADGAYWFTTHASALGPEPLDADEVIAEARAAFAGAAPVVHEALGERGGASATRLWVTPPLRRYVRGRFVVVGDAAHGMTPNLGRGACDALLDAVSLGATLRAGRSPARWEARRLPPTQVARVASGQLMRFALADRGHRARDRLLGLSRVGAGRPAGTR